MQHVQQPTIDYLFQRPKIKRTERPFITFQLMNQPGSVQDYSWIIPESFLGSCLLPFPLLSRTIDRLTGLEEKTGRRCSQGAKQPEQEETDAIGAYTADIVFDEQNIRIECCRKKNRSDTCRYEGRPEYRYDSLY